LTAILLCFSLMLMFDDHQFTTLLLNKEELF